MIHFYPKNTLLTLAILPVFTLSLSLPFFNQDQSWITLFHQTEALYQQGNYKKAFKVGNQAFSEARNNLQSDDAGLAEVEYLLGKIGYALGRFETASELYRSAQLIWEHTETPGNTASADCIKGLADIDYDAQRYQPALDGYQRAQDINQKILGPDHPEIARLWSDIARCEAALGLNTEAETHIRQAVSSLEKNVDPNSPDLALAYSIRSWVELNLNRADEALKSNEQALTILRKTGGNSAALGWVMYRQGEIDRSCGRYGNAETNFKQAVSILGKYLDRDHPRVAVAFIGWGETLRKSEDEERS